MYIVNKERALAQARALSGALALAHLAKWRFERSSSLILRPPFSNYLYIASAELLLVPSIEPSRADLDVVDRGMREARCDALVVKASSGGKPQLFFAFGHWQREGNEWSHGRRLWLARWGQAWLVPDPVWAEGPDTSILLGPKRCQVVSEPPARDDDEAARGFARADKFLEQIWETR